MQMPLNESYSGKTRYEDGLYKKLEFVEEPFAIALQFSADGKRKYFGYNYPNEAEEFIKKNSKKSLHEVTKCGIKGTQRLFLDVDAKYEDFKDATKQQIEQAYNVLLSGADALISHRSQFNDVDRFTLDGTRETKFSKHVVYKNVHINGEHYKCFCSELIANFRFDLEQEGLPTSLVKMIDAGVYGKTHCIRIQNSPKFGTNYRLRLEGANSDEFNKETMVTYTPEYKTGIRYYRCPDGCTGTEEIKKAADLNDTTLRGIEAAIDALKPFGITITKMDKQYPRITVDHSLPCYVCGNKHDSENLMCVIGEHDTKLICRRQPIGSKKRFKVILNHRKAIVDKPAPIDGFANKITNADRIPQISNTIGVDWLTLVLKGVMNSGKTRQLAVYISERLKANPNLICIVPTYRVGLANGLAVSLSAFIPADLKPFECYENLVGGHIDIEEHRLLTIQYESLHRLKLNDNMPDLVIIDEATSFAQQTLSGLNESKNGLNQLMLRNLLENSKQRILTDALIDNPTLDAYKQYLKNKDMFVWVVKPLTPWAAKVKTHKDPTRWRDDLLTDIKNGLKIYIATTVGESWIKPMRNLILANKPDAKILMIYGGLNDNARIISNINDEFVKYDVVIASPCISSGISFDVEDHFDKIYVYVDNSGPNAVDVIQSLRRVRNPKTKEVVICDSSYKYWYPTTFEDVFANEQQKLRFNKNDFIHDGIELIMNGPNYEFANASSPTLLFKLYCMRLRNLNSIDIFGTLLKFLEENGCTITEQIEKFADGTPEATQAKEEKKTFKTDKKKEKQKVYAEIAKARIISADEYDDLSQKLKGGRFKYKTINNEDTENLAIMRKFLNKDYEDHQMKKYQLLRHYGLHNCPSDKQKIFNTAGMVEKYSDDDVLRCYREMSYRELPIEKIEEIDAHGTNNMSDEDKLNYHYLAGRHTIISKIRGFFTAGFVEYETMRKYIEELYKKKIPMFARNDPPTNRNLLQMVNKLIIPYGFRVRSKLKGKDKERRRVLLLDDWAASLFDIKMLSITADETTLTATLHSGQINKPTVLVYLL